MCNYREMIPCKVQQRPTTPPAPCGPTVTEIVVIAAMLVAVFALLVIFQ